MTEPTTNAFEPMAMHPMRLTHDAAMLRFALNEKFINVDELIAMRKKGGVKKKLSGEF